MAGRETIYSQQAVKAARSMTSVKALAHQIGVSDKTIHAWAKKHKEFREAVEYARAKADRYDGVLPQYVQIMQHLANGMTVAATADAVSMAEASVQNSMAIVRRQMGYNTTLACVAEAMRRGWIE